MSDLFLSQKTKQKKHDVAAVRSAIGTSEKYEIKPLYPLSLFYL